MISAKELLKNKHININNDNLKYNLTSSKLNKNINIRNVNKNNDNVNNKLNNNVSINSYIEDIANNLVDKLNSPQSYKLFCKIAHNNPEPIISRCLGLTLESVGVRNKGGYFVSLIKIYGNY